MTLFNTRLRLIPHFLAFALPGLFICMAMQYPVWIAWPAGGSLYTFLLFGYDKYRAKRNATRTPEVVLLTLTALGGSPGTFLAMMFFHHKNRKASFLVQFILCAAISIGLVYALRSLQS